MVATKGHRPTNTLPARKTLLCVAALLDGCSLREAGVRAGVCRKVPTRIQAHLEAGTLHEIVPGLSARNVHTTTGRQISHAELAVCLIRHAAITCARSPHRAIPLEPIWYPLIKPETPEQQHTQAGDLPGLAAWWIDEEWGPMNQAGEHMSESDRIPECPLCSARHSPNCDQKDTRPAWLRKLHEEAREGEQKEAQA